MGATCSSSSPTMPGGDESFVAGSPQRDQDQDAPPPSEVEPETGLRRRRRPAPRVM